MQNRNQIGGTLHLQDNNITSESDLIIDGDVVANRIIATGRTVVASLKANVRAGSIECAVFQCVGSVAANIQASSLIQVENTAVLHGDITAPQIRISRDARFQGNMSYS